ncbi:hypothetical protein BS17DRAFT_718695 [Gyrodon lividus]|nr:hypothetical protein BS17DRAFT_718695 [Gyrodon lividus]
MANVAAKQEPADNYAFVTLNMVSISKALNIPVERCGAIIDSGATSHFCPNRSIFITFATIEP